MGKSISPRRAGIIWLLAGACMLAAAIISYTESGDITWLTVLAGVLMAFVGIGVFRRSSGPDAR